MRSLEDDTGAAVTAIGEIDSIVAISDRRTTIASAADATTHALGRTLTAVDELSRMAAVLRSAVSRSTC